MTNFSQLCSKGAIHCLKYYAKYILLMPTIIACHCELWPHDNDQGQIYNRIQLMQSFSFIMYLRYTINKVWFPLKVTKTGMKSDKKLLSPSNVKQKICSPGSPLRGGDFDKVSKGRISNLLKRTGSQEDWRGSKM